MRSKYKDVHPLKWLDPEERWMALGVAIVKQAVVDWKEADRIKKKTGDIPRDVLREKNSAQRFLASNTCEFYCGVEGSAILRMLKGGAL